MDRFPLSEVVEETDSSFRGRPVEGITVKEESYVRNLCDREGLAVLDTADALEVEIRPGGVLDTFCRAELHLRCYGVNPRLSFRNDGGKLVIWDSHSGHHFKAPTPAAGNLSQ